MILIEHLRLAEINLSLAYKIIDYAENEVEDTDAYSLYEDLKCNGEILIAYAKKTIVGYCIFWYREGPQKLTQLSLITVNEANRNKKIGTKLMTKLLNLRPNLFAFVHTENDDAFRFYARLGLKRTGVISYNYMGSYYDPKNGVSCDAELVANFDISQGIDKSPIWKET